ncbi:MAG: hypothetical protein AAGI63_07700 [Planctomycetota bacterium]
MPVVFFRAKPNLSDTHKAQIEFYFQQVVECIGHERVRLPVLSLAAMMEPFEAEPNADSVIRFAGKHLNYDTTGIQSHVEPKSTGASCSSGGCGGGTCDGPKGLIGGYQIETRTIVLDAEIRSDPTLGCATVVHGVVVDMIRQNKFSEMILPEMVEVAVIATGLGMPRNSVTLMGKSASYWDSTSWTVAPRPFLDIQKLAYANALAAWTRDENAPSWINDMAPELKRPMNNSLKYLFKTSDSFFDVSIHQPRLTQPQHDWWRLAESSLSTQQVIALRHLQCDTRFTEQQEILLVEKLRSANRSIVLHAIAAIERMSAEEHGNATEAILREWSLLTEHRDDEISAKSMCALTRRNGLSETTIETATNMLESSLRHVVFAGAYALSSLESISDYAVKLVDRCFVRALTACDYEFVEMFCIAYGRWFGDAEAHIKQLLGDSPEYLPVAMDILNREPDEVVSIG